MPGVAEFDLSGLESPSLEDDSLSPGELDLPAPVSPDAGLDLPGPVEVPSTQPSHNPFAAPPMDPADLPTPVELDLPTPVQQGAPPAAPQPPGAPPAAPPPPGLDLPTPVDLDLPTPVQHSNLPQPAGMDVRPAGMDVRPAGMDVRPAGMEVQPAGMDVQPAAMDLEPAFTGLEPAAMDLESATTGLQPAEMALTPAGSRPRTRRWPATRRHGFGAGWSGTRAGCRTRCTGAAQPRCIGGCGGSFGRNRWSATSPDADAEPRRQGGARPQTRHPHLGRWPTRRRARGCGRPVLRDPRRRRRPAAASAQRREDRYGRQGRPRPPRSPPNAAPTCWPCLQPTPRLRTQPPSPRRRRPAMRLAQPRPPCFYISDTAQIPTWR